MVVDGYVSLVYLETRTISKEVFSVLKYNTNYFIILTMIELAIFLIKLHCMDKTIIVYVVILS